MNQRAPVTISLIFLSLFSTTAFGQDLEFYLSGQAGLAFMNDAATTDSATPGQTLDLGFDSGIAFVGAFGARRDQYRTDFELGYQSHDLDTVGVSGMIVSLAGTGISGDVGIITGLVNVYYDMGIGHGLTPYLTAGMGFANIDTSITIVDTLGATVANFSDSDTAFAYQFGAGVGYDLSERVTLDLRYRYLGASDPEFGTVISEFDSHNVLFGLRFDF